MPFLNFKFKISNLKFSSGLTLIELLVVVAILGILASVTSVLLIGHAKQARDAQRKSDLVQLKKALSAAKNDCKASAYYPSPTLSDEKTSFTNLTAYLKNTNLKYMSVDVKDPKNDTTYYYRLKMSTQTASVCTDTANPPVSNNYAGTVNFVLRAKLENTNDPDRTNSYNQCTSAITAVAYSGVSPEDAPTSTDSFYYVCND